MHLESIRKYCLGKEGKITEEFPFDEETLVFKIGGKIFLVTDIEGYPLNMNLKCEPAAAIELRERYNSVRPGYHMNKKHWNTVILDGSIPDREIKRMIDISYHLVVKKLKKADQPSNSRRSTQCTPPEK